MGSKEEVAVQMASLSGELFPLVHMLPSQTVMHLKVQLKTVTGIPIDEQRLLFEENELSNETSLTAVGVTERTIVQMARVKLEVKPEVKPRPEGRRMMGKRA